MGHELVAPVRHRTADGEDVRGNARILVESDEVILRGEVKARLRREHITGVSARGGVVTIRHRDGVTTLTLHADASAFVERLLQPAKSRLDKMGIAPASTIALLHCRDGTFRLELAAHKVSVVERQGSHALVVLFVESADHLSRVGTAGARLPADGALWVVHPKGPGGVRDTDIFAVARGAGLTYTKVARFSDTHTAEKLVVPLRLREARALKGA